MTDFADSLTAMIPRLRRFAVALTGNLVDGDDLLQNALERALKRKETFRAGHKMDSWLFKIAQNLWIDQKRTEVRRGPQVEIEAARSVAGEDGRKKTEQRNMTKRVLAAIATLPEDQKLVVTHVLIDGQSYKEAAETLNIPVGTVMSRLYRGRKALEEQLL